LHKVKPNSGVSYPTTHTHTHTLEVSTILFLRQFPEFDRDIDNVLEKPPYPEHCPLLYQPNKTYSTGTGKLAGCNGDDRKEEENYFLEIGQPWTLASLEAIRHIRTCCA
ncbi:hypothetical protein ACTXT7_016301, partial [Hymenolepis weldensis]